MIFTAPLVNLSDSEMYLCLSCRSITGVLSQSVEGTWALPLLPLRLKRYLVVSRGFNSSCVVS